MPINSHSGRVVQVLHLGRMGYLQALDLQRRYARQHLKQQVWGMLGGRGQMEDAGGRDVLLTVEHHPVYTAGCQTAALIDQREERRLRALGAEVYRADRLGSTTFHGPGQLVAYPILNLRHFQGSSPSLRQYVTSLQATLVSTCRTLGLDDVSMSPESRDVASRRRPPNRVWMGDKQIGAVGVHVSQDFITTHGLMLNCDVDLSWFSHISHQQQPRGEVTSLTRHTGTPTPMSKVMGHFLEAFERHFRCQVEFSMTDTQDSAAALLSEEQGEGEEGEGEGALMIEETLLSDSGLRVKEETGGSAAETVIWAGRPCKPTVSMW